MEYASRNVTFLAVIISRTIIYVYYTRKFSPKADCESLNKPQCADNRKNQKKNILLYRDHELYTENLKVLQENVMLKIIPGKLKCVSCGFLSISETLFPFHSIC